MILKGLKNIILYLLRLPKYVYVLWWLSRLKGPIITFFGGKRVPKKKIYYSLAAQLSEKLVDAGCSVLTGGGPGIMEAALCAAVLKAGSRYGLGIGVSGVDDSFISACGNQTIHVGDFAMRKALLTQYSHGFIIMPGGYGTLDELLEVLNLIKVGKLQKVPIVLVGKEYWSGWQEWVNMAVKHDCIAPQFKDLFVITDDIDVACDIIIKHAKK